MSRLSRYRSIDLAEFDQISEEKISEYKDIFSYFDYDNDGKITTKEIRTAMDKMHIEINESELQDMVEKVDIDGNGSIDFLEFLNMMLNFQDDNNSVSDMREAFLLFDKDQNGYITRDELRDVMLNIGERLSDEEIDEMIRDADQDGDGQIDCSEFAYMMSQWK